MAPSMLRAAPWACALLLSSAACDSASSEPGERIDPQGVLTPSPVDDTQTGEKPDTIVADGGAPVEVDDAAMPPPAEDSGAPPVSVREVDKTITTTTPDAEFVYVGPGTPPISIVASNLTIENFDTDASADWFVRIRNERLSDTLCAFALTFTFKDSSGRVLFTMNPTFDMPAYLDSTGVTDCVGPGEAVNGNTLYFGEGKGPLALSDVATIEWKFQLGGYFDTLTKAADVTLTDLSIGSAALGPSLQGHVENNTSFTLQVFSVHTWVLNAGGMPLDYFIASYSGDLGAFQEWDFETNGSHYDFDLDDLEILPSYVR